VLALETGQDTAENVKEATAAADPKENVLLTDMS